jgi:hypothetical protein
MPSNPKPVRLTERDMAIADWLATLTFAEADQVARRFTMSRTRAYARLGALRLAGLVTMHRIFYGRPAVFQAGNRRIRPGLYEHELALARLAAEMQAEGHDLYTDRQLQDPEVRERLELGQLRRLPDAAIRSDAGLVAVEVELSSKGGRRRREILSAYALSPFARVIWLVRDNQLGDLISRDAAALGLEGRAAVARLEDMISPATGRLF